MTPMMKEPEPNEIEDWVCVFERGTEYEVEAAQNYLNSLEIPSNILSKRDSAFSLNIGDIAHVYLYVPKEFEEEALDALEKVDIPEDSDNEEE